MPRPSTRRFAKQPEMPVNNTVKLTESLRDRVAKAMQTEGFTVWSEFCRVALTEKCLVVERNLRSRDPHEFTRLYGRDGRDGKDGQDGQNKSVPAVH
jgi:hypothetical protein